MSVPKVRFGRSQVRSGRSQDGFGRSWGRVMSCWSKSRVLLGSGLCSVGVGLVFCWGRARAVGGCIYLYIYIYIYIKV
jgi:hypothetical protein